MWVAIGVAAAIAVVMIVLVTGGQPGGGTRADAAGDVVVEDGEGAPDDVTLADILEADVRRAGDRLIFDARVAKELPARLRKRSLEFRWDLSVSGADTWIVTASITVDTTAAVVSQQTPYGSSTIDGTMPGTVAIDGDRLVVELEPRKIKGFPEVFEWRLLTTLNANRRDPAARLARDSVPDQGTREVEG